MRFRTIEGLYWQAGCFDIHINTNNNVYIIMSGHRL